MMSLCFAMQHSENVLMIGMDDKAKIPVGEPGFRKAAVERNARFITTVDVEARNRAMAADHDQSSFFKLTPSVYLFHEIPRSESQTIYKGQPLVVLKNAVFEMSDPQRHAAELVDAIKMYHSRILASSVGAAATAMKANLPNDRSILVLNADGGVDHSCKHFRAVVWDLAICKVLDLDMLVHYRCYGGGSYINPVERCMAPLSASLSGVSTERSRYLDETLEAIFEKAGSMKQLRSMQDKFVASKISLAEATNTVLSNVVKDLQRIFQRTQYDGKFFMIGRKASDDALKEMESVLRTFYPGYDQKKCTWADYGRLGGEDEYFCKLIACPKHCNRTSYCFQFKKCGNPDGCEFGFCRPVRMNCEAFAELKFVPMPSPDPERAGKYVPFSKASELTDRYCPSKVNRAKPITEPLKVNFTTASHPDDLADLLVNKKVRAFIRCKACAKPRLLYSDTPLCAKSLGLLHDVEEDSNYVCGEEFIPEGHVLHRTWKLTETCPTREPKDHVSISTAVLIILVRITRATILSTGWKRGRRSHH
jgi:hypothetical protein